MSEIISASLAFCGIFGIIYAIYYCYDLYRQKHDKEGQQ